MISFEEFSKNIRLIVSAEYYIKPDDINLKTNKRQIVLPRQICHYFSNKYYNKIVLLQDIGNEFGNKDHCTVLHSIKTINNLANTNRDFNETIERLDNRILSSLTSGVEEIKKNRINFKFIINIQAIEIKNLKKEIEKQKVLLSVNDKKLNELKAKIKLDIQTRSEKADDVIKKLKKEFTLRELAEMFTLTHTKIYNICKTKKAIK